MRRSVWYFAVVIGGFVIAIGLRARTLHDPYSVPEAAPASSAIAAHDYVAEPVVALDEMNHGPRRIISMAPNITETVCALGMKSRLVGRTKFCTHPPGIESVASVGGLIDANYEKIRALESDLVLITENSTTKLAAELAALNLPVLQVPHETLDDVYRAIEVIGHRCARPKTAQTLIRLIKADIAATQTHSASTRHPALRVLITTGRMPVPPGPMFVAGPGSFLDSVLHLAGQVNAAAGLSTPYPELPLEKLLKINPDVILEFSDTVDPSRMSTIYEAWSKVGRLRAIERAYVRTVGTLELLSAGPRIAMTVERMRQLMTDLDTSTKR